MAAIQSLEELYITLKDEEDLNALKNVIDKQKYDFDLVKADVNGNEEIKEQIPQKLYSKMKALINGEFTNTSYEMDLGPSNLEYEAMIAKAIHLVCEEIYKIVVPDAILKFISELCSLSIETQILTWDNIQWIYSNVIPNRYMTDRLYCVSTMIDNEDQHSFKQYDSYKFHDCVDEKGATIFIIDCKHNNSESMIIGGFCDKSWFSPYKRNLEDREGNCGWFVSGSVDCKLFVLRNNELTKKLASQTSNISLPLLATNLTTNQDIMVAANADGPNFGYNHFYITNRGYIRTHLDSRYFNSPIADIKFGQFMTYKGNESIELEHEQKRHYYSQAIPQVISLEVFAVQSIQE